MTRKNQAWWNTFSAALGQHLNDDYAALDIPPADKLFGVKTTLTWWTDFHGSPEDPEVLVRANVREFCLTDPSIRRVGTSTTFRTSVRIDTQGQITVDSPVRATPAYFVADADNYQLMQTAADICRPKIAEMVKQAASTTMRELCNR